MASDRFVLTRPIEVTSANDGFRVDYNGGGWDALTLTQGVYGSIATYAKEVETQLDTVNAGFDVSFTSDFYITISHTTNTFKIEWTEAGSGQVLGFDAACEPVAISFTATQIPRYCFLPTRVRGDLNTWEPNFGEQFKGIPAQSGIVSGLSTGETLYSTKVTLPYEPAENLKHTLCTTAAEKVRCLDEFVIGSRVSYPSSGNVSPGGFYFWPDYTDVDVLASMDGGDCTTFNYVSSPDEYVFCEFDPTWTVPTTEGLDNANTYRNVDIPIKTSTYPTGGWSAP